MVNNDVQLGMKNRNGEKRRRASSVGVGKKKYYHHHILLKIGRIITNFCEHPSSITYKQNRTIQFLVISFKQDLLTGRVKIAKAKQISRFVSPFIKIEQPGKKTYTATMKKGP